MITLTVVQWYHLHMDRVRSSTSVEVGGDSGSSGSFGQSGTSRDGRWGRGQLSWQDDLCAEPIAGEDLGSADERWLRAVAARSADWFSHVTGIPWTPAARALFLGKLTAISRHWSDPSGHGLNRGWHRDAPGSERAPWTSRQEREICWPALAPHPVCRRQGDAVTRLVLGTPTCPGHFDLLRHGPRLGDAGVPGRTVQSWAAAVYLCDPVAAIQESAARYQAVRAAAAEHYSGHVDENLWELGLSSIQHLDLSA